jgi:hypothetical protein
VALGSSDEEFGGLLERLVAFSCAEFIEQSMAGVCIGAEVALSDRDVSLERV